MELSERELRRLIVNEAETLISGIQPWAPGPYDKGDIQASLARMEEFANALPLPTV